MVSVIIPTVRNDPHIDKCIHALKESIYQDIEIVVVNEGLERSLQRNIGIQKAKGEYLLILDADQRVSPGLIGHCVDLMKYYDAIYIPEMICTEGFFGRLRNWERQFYTGTLVDVVRFVKAKDCPLFDPAMSGPEDADWDRRVQGKRYTSYYYLYHYDNVGFIGYCKKKAYYAKSMATYHDKNPQDKVLDLKYRCWTVFTENGKWKRLIAHPFYTLCLIGLLLIRGILYKGVKK